jgi:hypothetical protein
MQPADNATYNKYMYGGYNAKIFHEHYWNTASKTMVFDIKITPYKDGLYNVSLLGYQHDKIVLRVYDPLLSIKLPKKTFVQGEVVQFSINNPYIDIKYRSNDILSSPPGYFRHKFKIVPTYPSVYVDDWKPMYTNYPEFFQDQLIIPYDQNLDMKTSQLSNRYMVPYEPNEYKIILLRENFVYPQGSDRSYGETAYIGEVVNSTFSVKRNYPNLTVTTIDASNCSKVLIGVSLTTSSNIPLIGPYTIDIVKLGTEFSSVYQSKRMKEIYYPKQTLNTTVHVIDKENPEEHYGPREYITRIVLDNRVWALSNSFTAGCYKNA